MQANTNKEQIKNKIIATVIFVTEASSYLTYYSPTNQTACVKPLIQDCLYGQIAYLVITMSVDLFIRLLH